MDRERRPVHCYSRQDDIYYSRKLRVVLDVTRRWRRIWRLYARILYIVASELITPNGDKESVGNLSGAVFA